jgi:hypothetical protein
MRWRCLLPLIVLTVVGCKDNKGAPTPPPGGMTVGDESASLSAPVSGAIMGRAFQPDQVVCEGRKLSFTRGKEIIPDMEISFELPGPDDAQLTGKEWNFGGNHFDHPTLTVSTRQGQDLPQNPFVFPSDYTMALKITKQTGSSLEGTIDLRCNKLPNTRLAGKFTATVTRTAEQPPIAEDAPYVCGKIVMVGEWQNVRLGAGFVGTGTDGKRYSNMAGTQVSPGGGEWMSSGTFKPQLTSLVNHATNGPGYKHVRMAPGDYVIYVRRADVPAAWKKVTVKADDQLTIDLTVDPAKTGGVTVTLPDEEAKDASEWGLSLVPSEFDRADMWMRNAFEAAKVKVGTKTVTVQGVPAGKYVAVRGKSEAEVEVAAGKTAAVTLVRKEPTK